MQALNAELDAFYAFMLPLIVAVSLLGIVVSTLLAVAVVIFTIIRPIRAITGTMRTLATGDVSVAIPGTERGDEIGQMAAAVQVFKDNAVTARRLEAEQHAEHERKEKRQAAVDGFIADFDSAMTSALRGLASESTEMNSTATSMTATAEEAARQATTVAAAGEQASTNVQTVAPVLLG